MTNSTSEIYNFSATYDKNGNIMSLNRNGVDALTYNYSNSGNRLNAVSDGITGNTDVGDFRDGNTAGMDYEYYTDGSLKKDLNKGINLIEYDPFLSKVKQVSFSNGKWVRFEYSGDGTLIKRSNSDGEYWDYSQSIIYKNGSPYQMTTSEGRAVYNGGSWTYEFEYRDQIGDLRMAFKNENGLAKISQQSTNDVFGLEVKGLSSIESGNTTQNNFLFLGKENIKELGWHQLGLRMYSPDLGRFNASDPVPDVMGQEVLSPYQYGVNNPLRYPDPKGDCGKCLKAGIKTVVKSISKGKLDLSEAYDIAENVGTLLDGQINMADAEAIFNLVSPVDTKELKAGKKFLDKLGDVGQTTKKVNKNANNAEGNFVLYKVKDDDGTPLKIGKADSDRKNSEGIPVRVAASERKAKKTNPNASAEIIPGSNRQTTTGKMKEYEA